MIGRLLELFEGPEAPGPWSPPAMPAPLHSLLPWRAWDESSELYVNAASTGFVLELPPFAGIDAETGLPRGCAGPARARWPDAAPNGALHAGGALLAHGGAGPRHWARPLAVRHARGRMRGAGAGCAALARSVRK